MTVISISKFDLYGQLGIWLLSIATFFLFFMPEYTTSSTYWGW